jgi:hypothetical protein
MMGRNLSGYETRGLKGGAGREGREGGEGFEGLAGRVHLRRRSLLIS